MPALSAVLARATQAHRARTLASDERAGSWTRAQVRTQWAEFIRARWRLLLGMATTAAVAVTLVTYLAPNAFLRGAVVGAGTVGTLTALTVLVVQATGTSSMSHGASAEQVTDAELRPLLKHGWRLINHVSLKQWDIDHVLIGPAGVIAVETKWSATEWDLDAPSQWVTNAVRQVCDNADDLRRWAPVTGAGVRAVWSTVFLWNHAFSNTVRPDQPQRVDGTTVVLGEPPRPPGAATCSPPTRCSTRPPSTRSPPASRRTCAGATNETRACTPPHRRCQLPTGQLLHRSARSSPPHSSASRLHTHAVPVGLGRHH